MQPGPDAHEPADALALLVARFENAVEQQARAGQELVTALRDQVADGQVETLLTLERAGHDVHRAAGDLERRVDERLTRLVTELEPAVRRVGEAGVSTVQGLQDAGAALRQTADQVWVQLAAMVTRMAEEGHATAARAQEVAADVEQRSHDELERSTSAMAARADEAQRIVGEAAEQLSARADAAQHAVVDAASRLTTQVEDAVTTLGRVTRDAALAVAAAQEQSAAALADAAADAVTAFDATHARAFATVTETGEDVTSRLQRGREQLADALTQVQGELLAAMQAERAAWAEDAERRAAESLQAAREEREVWEQEADRRRGELLQALRADRDARAADAAQSMADLQAIAARMLIGMQEAADQTVARTERTGDDLLARLEAGAVQAQDRAIIFLEDLQDLLRHWQERDARQERRVDDRVKRLVERADATLTSATRALAAETERLVARDATQEQQRADQFVRVLDELIVRSGGRRDVRRRVLRVLERDRVSAPAPSPEQPSPSPVPTRPRRASVPTVSSEGSPPAAPVKQAVKRRPRKAGAMPARQEPARVEDGPASDEREQSS